MLKQTAIAIALVGLSSAALAGWQVKVGASAIAPTGSNTLSVPAGAATLTATGDISNELAFTPSVEYIVGDTPFSVEVLLSNPVKHTVSIAAAGTTFNDAVSFKQLPPTVTAKYNFKNPSRFTPYIGVGVATVIPWDEELSTAVKSATGNTKIDADVAYGVAGQVGFNFQPADAKNWGVYFDARYADIKTDVTITNAAGTEVKAGDLKVNPWVYTLGYSYRF